MSITMEDVAHHVGVAKSTVSLALNNKPGVSDELRETIMHAADELGYRLQERKAPRPAGDRKSVVVIHGEHQEIEGGPSILYLKYLEGIQAYFETHYVNFSVYANYQKEPANLTFQLLNREWLAPDGFILMGSIAKHDGRLLHQLCTQQIPVVALSRNWTNLPISTVSQDHEQQATLALNHLVELGHCNIGFVAQEVDQNCDWFNWRLNAYKKAMAKQNGTLDETLIFIKSQVEDAVKALLEQRPDTTAIFAINDQRAVKVLQVLHELGIQIPEKISVIGLDNALTSPEGLPGLTTVTFPHFEVGYLGAELLLKQIENTTLYYSNIIVKSELVERSSCAPPYN